MKRIQAIERVMMQEQPLELRNIDRICRRFSEEMAGPLRDQSVPGTPLASLNEQVQAVTKKAGVVGGHGPVRSSFEENGRVIEFTAYIQSFEVTSPLLFDLGTSIARRAGVSGRRP